MFYFFRKDAQSPLSYRYDGQEVATHFDLIVHDTCGCDYEDRVRMQADEESGQVIFRGSIQGEAQVASLRVIPGE